MKSVTIKLDDPNLSAMASLELALEGQSPLVVHRFSEKAKKEMLDKQMGVARGKKPPKDPVKDYLASIYYIGKAATKEADLKKCRFGFPAVAFKAAAVRCAKGNGATMTDARTFFFVQCDAEELVELTCPNPPIMREDAVRLQGGVSDLRHRAQFMPWGTTLRVLFNARKVTAEQLTSWFIDAGICSGVGEMRPNGRTSSGVFGTWAVKSAKAMVPELS